MSKSGIVNVRMVITEEKILSNIDKVQKLINPKSKKQIVQLEDDTYFKDLVESIKTYLLEYPKKKNFPKQVYKQAYGLVEYATNQFEENTKRIEDLIRQRENNIALAGDLKVLLATVDSKDKEWKSEIKKAENKFGDDIIEALGVVGRSKSEQSQNYADAVKLIKARIVNLESNLHIEIDMERIEDRSKALSYIGIEIADALKVIPAPVDYEKEETVVENENVSEIKTAVQMDEPSIENVQIEEPIAIANTVVQAVNNDYIEDTRLNVKPSLWQKFKNSKIVKRLGYLFRIKVVLDIPSLPEGRRENS